MAGIVPLITLIDGLACATLVFVAVEDARRFRIRNNSILVLVGLFGLAAGLSYTGHDVFWHCAFATLILLLMFGAFSLGLVGAGDAKLLAAACLWIGPEGALLFAIALLCMTGLYGVGAKFRFFPTQRDDHKVKIPFAPSIALAWIMTIVLA
uniref:A24 family peptidase n=1 Tax=Methylobacterium sp. TaxID=409 RepID=UPI0020C9DA45|nr:prepilin peptidase [Methylobacterium sp.]USU34607.1 prepilin peptidase [Methylobacterium sp.]